MLAIVERLSQPQAAATALGVVVVAIASAVVHHLATRMPLHPKAPKLWTKDDWPLAGAWDFYTRRSNIYREAQKSTPTGNFSLYIGQKLVVALSGDEAKKTFFEHRGLNLSQGNGELFAGTPAPATDHFYHFFLKTNTNLLKTPYLIAALGHLTSDTRRALDGLAAGEDWKVMKIFDVMEKLVYQLTTRTVGAREIAEDPALLERTLRLFADFEGRTSPARIFFTWLPTPNHLVRMWNAIQLYRIFDGIIKKRAKSDTRIDDPFQRILDDGASVQDAVGFEIAALFAGVINSSIHAAYVPLYWVQNPKLMARARQEVDGVVAKYRAAESQSPADVLDSLTLEQWEKEFRFLDACLRESIRIGQPGTAFRKNTSGAEIPIGGTGEVIPRDAFAAYMMDDTGMRRDLYPEPLAFDPDRYEGERAGAARQPHSYLGWGSGRHMCLGMRFAKLEVAMVNAYLVAGFDIELSDAEGNLRAEPLKPINRNLNQMNRPAEDVWLRYRKRVY